MAVEQDGQTFIPNGERGYMVLPVLEYLKGRPWDELALGVAQSLRPRHIRVLRHDQGTHCDSMRWRVTVRLTEAGVIGEITQEVEVGLPDGVANGHEMRNALRREPKSIEMAGVEAREAAVVANLKAKGLI